MIKAISQTRLLLITSGSSTLIDRNQKVDHPASHYNRNQQATTLLIESYQFWVDIRVKQTFQENFIFK